MDRPRLPAARSAAGFMLIEVMLTMLIVSLLAAITIPIYQEALVKARSRGLQADGKTLHSALMRYYRDEGAFPSEDALNTTTLAPLTTNGYLRSGEAITSKLAGGALFVYLAPDVDGANQQFVTILRHAADPGIIVGVVHTNLVTDDGDWVDGSYVIDEDDLEDAGL